jgi:lactate permease
MLSPQNVAIAVSTAKLDGKDGEILRRVLKYCAIYLAILCLIVLWNPYAQL